MKNKIKNSKIYNAIPKDYKKKMLNIYHILKKDGYYIKKDGNYYCNKKYKKNVIKISFIIPQPIIGSGGHRNIYRIVKYLANKGYKIICYIDPEGIVLRNHVKTGKKAHQKIKNNFFDLNCDIVFGVENISNCDVLFATHAASAYIVKRNEKKAKLCCYFIQDYEAYFQPMGDNYLSAHNTYKLGLYPITSGPWPLEMLKKNFGINYGNYFRFPIDTKVYYFDNNFRKDNRIVFFAKPGMPRRCYHLGLEALNIVKQKYPEIEVVLYGENKSHYKNVPFKFNNIGLAKTIKDLGNLYRTATIGIAFSTTNPSLVPYEMMACGCPVVDFDFNNSVVSYDSKNNITLVDTTPEKIAEGIISLYKNKALREKQMNYALKFCKKLPTENEMCELIEQYILEQYNKVKK